MTRYNYDDPDNMEDFYSEVSEDISSTGTYSMRLLFLKQAKKSIKNYEQWLKRKIKKENEQIK